MRLPVAFTHSHHCMHMRRVRKKVGRIEMDPVIRLVILSSPSLHFFSVVPFTFQFKKSFQEGSSPLLSLSSPPFVGDIKSFQFISNRRTYISIWGYFLLYSFLRILEYKYNCCIDDLCLAQLHPVKHLTYSLSWRDRVCAVKCVGLTENIFQLKFFSLYVQSRKN